MVKVRDAVKQLNIVQNYDTGYLLYGLAILTVLFMLNIVLSLILWLMTGNAQLFHPYFALILLLGLGIFLFFIVVDFYQSSKHITHHFKFLALKSLQADSLIVEERNIMQLNAQVASELNVPVQALYLLDDVAEIQSFAYGQEIEKSFIALSWGSLYRLDTDELKALLYFHYLQIHQTHTQYKSHFFIAFTRFTRAYVYARYLLEKGFDDYQQQRVCRGIGLMSIAMLGCALSYPLFYVQRKIQYSFFYDAKQWDLIVLQSFQQQALIKVLHRIAQTQFPREPHYKLQWVEFLSFATLNRQCLQRRLMALQDITEQYEHTAYPSNFYSHTVKDKQKWSLLDYFYLLFTGSIKQHKFHIIEQKQSSVALKKGVALALETDEIRPLQPDLRSKKVKIEYLNKISATKVHYLYTLTLIFQLRKSYTFSDDQLHSSVSIGYLLQLDPRLYVELFRQSCQNIQHIPQKIAQQYVENWSKIIHKNNEVTLVDALLLEVAKEQLAIQQPVIAYKKEDIALSIVQLIDGILFTQQGLYERATDFRASVLQQLLGNDWQQYAKHSASALDFAMVFSHLQGLHTRDRLHILNIAEMCLKQDRGLTQEGLDVLVLLYWRLGFDAHRVEERLYKRNLVAIF